jgi:hypothetical protein
MAERAQLPAAGIEQRRHIAIRPGARAQRGLSSSRTGMPRRAPCSKLARSSAALVAL